MGATELDITLSQEAQAWLKQVNSTWETIPSFQVNPQDFSHLAIICDGNRRGAKARGLNPWLGHRMGVEVIKGIMDAGRQWGIKHLTFWAWSTENWKRDGEQIDFVMNLAARFLGDQKALQELVDNQVKFTHIGKKTRIPSSVRESIEGLEAKTAGFDKWHVNLALDYGGLDEASRGIAKALEWIRVGKLSEAELIANPGMILGFLDTAGQPVPDLVIRTGMTEDEIPRTSGFMPLQTAYSGWKFSSELFTDLTPNSLLESVKVFLSYKRRMGK